MSLSNINILFGKSFLTKENYKAKEKSKYVNDNSKTPDKKGTDITKKGKLITNIKDRYK